MKEHNQDKTHGKAGAARYVGQLSRHFRHYCDEMLEPYGLTNGLYLYLLYINYHSGCSMVEVGEGLHVDKGLVTRMITRLCQLGYISKERREEDARSFSLNLTEEGRSVFSHVRDLPASWERMVFGSLSDREQELLTQLLEKVCCFGEREGCR